MQFTSVYKPFLSILLLVSLVLTSFTASANPQCKNVSLVILGSGGPELDDGRNSSGFAILEDDKVKVLVDAGMGTSREFERMTLRLNDLEAILITHLHVDHVDDLPVYIKGAFFTGRAGDLSIIGPWGNQHLPSMKTYLDRLLDKDTGLYPYLYRHLPRYEAPYAFKIRAKDARKGKEDSFKLSDNISASSIPTSHGVLPSIAWRVNVAGCELAFMGDSGVMARDKIAAFSEGVDLLVLNMPLEVGAPEPVHVLHMEPTDLAKIAKGSKAEKIVLAHFMKRSIRALDENAEVIRKAAKGPVVLAEDGLRIDLK